MPGCMASSTNRTFSATDQRRRRCSLEVAAGLGIGAAVARGAGLGSGAVVARGTGLGLRGVIATGCGRSP